MTQPLNYSVKAAAALRSVKTQPVTTFAAAALWLADMLDQAETFILPEYGQLLDRSRPNPEVPADILRPPFSIVACEYEAARDNGRPRDFYTETRSSRRIALAWDFAPGSMPDYLRGSKVGTDLRPGVCIASIFYLDDHDMWAFAPAALHIAYDAKWLKYADLPPSPFQSAMVASGVMSKQTARTGGSFEAGLLPLAVEPLMEVSQKLGSMAAAVDSVRSDLNDEANAYSDLCHALACKNVSPERLSASAPLNTSRAKSGKPPLKDFHVLKIDGADYSPEIAGNANPTMRRSHLRRGHIRRLGPDRLTWVSQTIVRGRGGFADKAYSVGGGRE